MTALGTYLLIIMLAGAAVAAVGILIYNRRASKIAKGEVRDRHSVIPAPQTTVNAVYKIVLMIVVVLALLNTSALHSRVYDLQTGINNLRSSEYELSMIREMIEKSTKRILYSSVEYSGLNASERTGKMLIKLGLSEYSENTKVALSFNKETVPFQEISPGNYEAAFTVDLFQTYTEPMLHIVQDGVTFAEPAYDLLPETVFWDFLPMPTVQSEMSFRQLWGNVRYEGGYYIWAGHPEEIEKVQVTYLIGGKEIASRDVTGETLNHEIITLEQGTLEQGLKVDENLVIRIEVLTKSGFRIIDEELMLGASDSTGAEGLVQIQDLSGKVLWEMR